MGSKKLQRIVWHPRQRTSNAHCAHLLLLAAGLLCSLLSLRGGAASDPEPWDFVILGDRTGEAVPGAYEQAWQAAAAERPAFAISVGDTIEGLHDASALTQWQEVERILAPYKRYPLYLIPGNHDIWSPLSERLFRQYAGRAPHYSFDYGQAHFTILDNSRTEDFSAGELSFLENDLKAHAARPVKLIFSHRPSWLINAALQNPNFPLHQLARQYGVQYVIAGHVHQMLRLELQGVTYLSMPSSGGHLRASGEYSDGWFFGHALVEVHGTGINFKIEELKPPYGQGRVTKLLDWGMHGLHGAVAARSWPQAGVFTPGAIQKVSAVRAAGRERFRCIAGLRPPPSSDKLMKYVAEGERSYLYRRQRAIVGAHAEGVRTRHARRQGHQVGP